uniref:Uncharacterized protein n=1 Tax=Timema tahoe TaxID=61484 RepID=A0A7R9FMI3_9NEOP|nr:unnamed protein product [Timema tahoe]
MWITRCVYGHCDSNTKDVDKPRMRGVFFIGFPERKKELSSSSAPGTYKGTYSLFQPSDSNRRPQDNLARPQQIVFPAISETISESSITDQQILKSEYEGTTLDSSFKTCSSVALQPNDREISEYWYYSPSLEHNYNLPADSEPSRKRLASSLKYNQSLVKHPKLNNNGIYVEQIAIPRKSHVPVDETKHSYDKQTRKTNKLNRSETLSLDDTTYRTLDKPIARNEPRIVGSSGSVVETNLESNTHTTKKKIKRKKRGKSKRFSYKKKTSVSRKLARDNLQTHPAPITFVNVRPQAQYVTNEDHAAVAKDEFARFRSYGRHDIVKEEFQDEYVIQNFTLSYKLSTKNPPDVSFSGSVTSLFKQLLNCPHEAELTSFQTHCFTGNSGSAGDRTRDLELASDSDTLSADSPFLTSANFINNSSFYSSARNTRWFMMEEFPNDDQSRSDTLSAPSPSMFSHDYLEETDPLAIHLPSREGPTVYNDTYCTAVNTRDSNLPDVPQMDPLSLLIPPIKTELEPQEESEMENLSTITETRGDSGVMLDAPYSFAQMSPPNSSRCMLAHDNVTREKLKVIPLEVSGKGNTSMRVETSTCDNIVMDDNSDKNLVQRKNSFKITTEISTHFNDSSCVQVANDDCVIKNRDVDILQDREDLEMQMEISPEVRNPGVRVKMLTHGRCVTKNDDKLVRTFPGIEQSYHGKSTHDDDAPNVVNECQQSESSSCMSERDLLFHDSAVVEINHRYLNDDSINSNILYLVDDLSTWDDMVGRPCYLVISVDEKGNHKLLLIPDDEEIDQEHNTSRQTIEDDYKFQYVTENSLRNINFITNKQSDILDDKMPQLGHMDGVETISSENSFFGAGSLYDNSDTVHLPTHKKSLLASENQYKDLIAIEEIDHLNKNIHQMSQLRRTFPSRVTRRRKSSNRPVLAGLDRLSM